MEYNTSGSKLLMPEYGRNIQSMAEQLLTIEDEDKRLKNAEAIIDVMAILNPHLKQIEDYRHKLWDHLYQMTDFKLVVNSPYPAPTAEEVRKKPEVLPYPAKKIKHRHLGGNIEQILEKAVAESNPEKKEGYTQHIAYFMKLAYANWHREPAEDDSIRQELKQITQGALEYEGGNGFKVVMDPRPNGNANYGKKKNKGGRSFQGGNSPSGNFNKNKKSKNKNRGNMA